MWDSVLAGALDTHDGHNVVFHEFAHQLDQESGASDGAPPLPRRAMYLPWARVLGREYDRLARDAERHHRTLIDQYGATNPAEFFAVATETFFERPRRLKSKRPSLYAQLKEFYRQDPAEIVRPVGAAEAQTAEAAGRQGRPGLTSWPRRRSCWRWRSGSAWPRGPRWARGVDCARARGGRRDVVSVADWITAHLTGAAM